MKKVALGPKKSPLRGHFPAPHVWEWSGQKGPISGGLSVKPAPRGLINPYLFVYLPIKTKKSRTFGAHLHIPARGKVGYSWHGAAKLITGAW
jgi:hypothetical protein